MGHLDIVKYLMEEYNGSYIDREPRNIYDVTPLHAAALEGHREIVEYLMRRVRDRSPKTKMETPYYIGVQEKVIWIS